ncbi:MAG TPA: hypothetical protein VEU29_08650 [Actinomycetota bacterium]|nr:hypothetical protein [Actinomycetota bacterium]
MRKSLVLTLTAGLVATSLAVPAVAAKKAKPVKTTLYLHGSAPIGEADNFAIVAPGTYMTMDATEPSGAEPKSKQLTNYVGGPNTQCTGNDLFPVWVGDLTGTVTGDMKVTFHTIASGGSVDVQVWPDVASQLCNNDLTGAAAYPEPAGTVRVDLPQGPGNVEAVIEGVKFKAGSKLMLQLTPVVESPFFGRVLYDSTAFVSSIEFGCIPAKGAKSCTP